MGSAVLLTLPALLLLGADIGLGQGVRVEGEALSRSPLHQRNDFLHYNKPLIHIIQ